MGKDALLVRRNLEKFAECCNQRIATGQPLARNGIRGRPMLPEDFALAVALGNARRIALGHEDTSARQQLGIVRPLQAGDLPAQLAVFAELPNASAAAAVIFANERQSQRRLFSLEPGHVHVGVMLPPPGFPGGPTPTAFLVLAAPKRHG